MKKRILMFLLVLLLLSPFVVAAQGNPPANPCTGGADGNIGKCVSQVYVWSLGISGMLAVAVIVWGGFQVMTARGNGAQASEGKKYIYAALSGMVLLFGAYIILNTVNTDLTNFTTPEFDRATSPVQQPAAPANSAPATGTNPTNP